MDSISIKRYFYNISNLPIKESYEKEELLIKDFFIEKEKNLEIYFCTHNEYINANARIFIVGITPGFQQMNRSIVVARKCLEENMPLNEIFYICKREGRFYGIIRKNIIEMLDELELNKVFNIKSCEELFAEKDYLLHTTSMIPYAVFSNGNNYTGHSPKIFKSELLLKYVNQYFYPQVELLKEALIVPLGKCVEEVLWALIDKRIIEERQCLMGFPHPSGANGHRLIQFSKNKESMKNIINFWGEKLQIRS